MSYYYGAARGTGAAGGPPPGAGAIPAHRSNTTTPTVSATVVGTHAVTYPATVSAGDRIIMVAYARHNGSTSRSITLHANAVSAGFVELGKVSTANDSYFFAIRDTAAAGTEDGTTLTNCITVAAGGTLTAECFLATMMSFGANDGFASPGYANVSIDATAVGTSALTAKNCVTDGLNQLAVQLFAIRDEINWNGTDVFDVEWDVEMNATTTAGADGQVGCQTSDDYADGSDYTAADVITLTGSSVHVGCGLVLRPTGTV